MKKLFFSAVLVVLCISLFAQVTPYGSVRTSYWYEIQDEDANLFNSGVKESRMNMNFGLQPNSRFGVDFKTEGWNSKVEMGLDNSNRVSVRHAWVKRQFDNWALSFGQMEDGMYLQADQVWGGDLNLNGYGVVYGGRNPAIRADFCEGFYAALITPVRNRLPVGIQNDVDFLIPKINLGWNGAAGKVTLKPSAMLQMYSYNKDFIRTNDPGSNDVDETVLSWLVALTADYKDNAFKARLHLNFGMNTGNMGFAGSNNTVRWGVKQGQTDPEIFDTSTLGVMGQFGFDLNDSMYLGAGAGYSLSSNDLWDNDDARMGLFLQSVMSGWGFKFIPEVGMMMEMDNIRNDFQGQTVARGSMMYFGTQLRFDF